MNKKPYHSLSQKLKQNGIIPTNEKEITFDNSKENFFENPSAFEENGVENIFEKKHENKKRLNQFDLDLVNDFNNTYENKEIENSFNSVRRFLNFKQNKLKFGKTKLSEIIFAKIFPRLYEAKLAKEAVNKFLELDIDTQTLLNKTVPYGENETRYKDLVAYLKYANELKNKINKKIN